MCVFKVTRQARKTLCKASCNFGCCNVFPQSNFSFSRGAPYILQFAYSTVCKIYNMCGVAIIKGKYFLNPGDYNMK